MRGDSRDRKKVIKGEVAIADGVKAVLSDARKTELARNGLAVDAETVARERPGTHGTRVGAFLGMLETCDVARKSLGMRQQKMRKQDWLRVLHVGHSRHRRGNVGFRLPQESVKHGLKTTLSLRDGVHDKEAEIGGHEFVAAST